MSTAINYDATANYKPLFESAIYDEAHSWLVEDNYDCAYLALTTAAIAMPTLFAQSPVLVAFAGGMVAALLVYAIAAK